MGPRSLEEMDVPKVFRSCLLLSTFFQEEATLVGLSGFVMLYLQLTESGRF